MLAGKEPGRIPQARIAHAVAGEHDHEHGRAIHDHHLAGLPHADALGFGRSIDGADDDRRPGGKPGLVGCLAGNASGDIRRPGNVGQPIEFDDVAAERIAPRPLFDQIERAEVGGAVVIDDAFAGETMNQVGGGAYDLMRGREYLGPAPLQPQDFGPDRLRGQRVAASLEKGLFADGRDELADFRRGTRIDAIEHGIHERLAGGVDRQHARADGTGANRADVARAHLALGEQSAAQKSEIVPPVLAWAMLGPAWCRHQHAVRLGGGGDDRARGVDQNPLRFEGADIDAEVVPHRCWSSRSRLKRSSIAAMPAVSSRVSPTRSERSQTSSEEWV